MMVVLSFLTGCAINRETERINSNMLQASGVYMEVREDFVCNTTIDQWGGRLD